MPSRTQFMVAILLCATLGLAPFAPEPHLFKQALNLIHGRPMGVMDVVDIFVHGAPFAYLGVLIARALRRKAE